MLLNDRNKFNFVTNCCWLTICLLSLTITFITSNTVQALSIQQTHKDSDELGGHLEHNANALPQEPTVININPRLDYNNEWRPVGRGDPLKNDPTYDYSPPALERVRYWRADNESKDDKDDNYSNNKQYSKDFATNNKKEILLLGMPSERHRGQPLHGESSHLQPKYTAIRRSYYAHQHQLPTHLMPPPMQTLAPPSGHQMKPAVVTGEYRHSMPSSTTTTMGMMYSKPYFSTSATSASSPWMHHTSSTAMSSTSTLGGASAMTPALMQHYRPQQQQQHSPQQQHNTPLMHTYEHDHHHQQETINQFSYTRPSMSVSFTPNNFIDSHPNVYKHGSSVGGLRKPWLHELLQKEVVKLPPKMSLNKYEQMPTSIGISTTQLPMAFMPLSTTTTTTPPSPTMSTTMHLYTTTSPIYFTTTAMAPTIATSTTTLMPLPVTSTSKRLLIPTTSNLVHRPTVVPMKMTTDALFKHYNQPETPLLGPMYLIIEGHSKVKTYGKDELDPHRPKIVPIVPKREPVVRIADPNEKRGTMETFQVKHLHTKTTAPMSETTSTTTTTPSIITTTTKAPKQIKTEPKFIPKKETTTKSAVTTTATTTTKTTSTAIPTTSTTTKPLTTEPPKINKVSDEALPTTNDPPTGIAGLFNFLDSSLGSLFSDDQATPPQPLASNVDNKIFVTTPPTATKLHPIITTTIRPPAQIEARIGTHSDSIDSLLDFNEDENGAQQVTTEPVPRDIRQVFDYDQLPESRLKDRMDVNVKEDNEDDDEANNEVAAAAALADDSDEDVDMEGVENLTSIEYEDENHQLIKRIDKLVDDVDDDNNEEIEFEELMSTEVDDGDDEDDDLDLRRAHKMA